LKPETIVHVGAHEAEELEAYESSEWGQAGIVWFEALEEKSEILRQRTRNRVGDAVHIVCLWSEDDSVVDLKVASNGQSTSVLDFGYHAELYPDITFVESRKQLTRTGDSFRCFKNERSIGLMNIDVQGTEQQVLIGFEETMERVNAVYCEVNTQEIYVGGAFFSDLDQWLRLRGFELCDWEISHVGWGDALWIREGLVPRYARVRRIVRKILFQPPHQVRRMRSALIASPVGQWTRRLLRNYAWTGR